MRHHGMLFHQYPILERGGISNAIQGNILRVTIKIFLDVCICTLVDFFPEGNIVFITFAFDAIDNFITELLQYFLFGCFVYKYLQVFVCIPNDRSPQNTYHKY